MVKFKLVQMNIYSTQLETDLFNDLESIILQYIIFLCKNSFLFDV